MSIESTNQFSKTVAKYRDSRNWSQADLARESGLTQAEISRVESFNEPVRYDAWVAYLVDLGERVRIDARSGPGRWAKR